MRTREKEAGHVETPVDGIAEAIMAAMPALDRTDQQIATAVHRLMANGEPVEPAAVSRAVGDVSVDRVNERLNSWPGVFRDGNGRVVGIWGHAIAKLAEHDGTTLLPVEKAFELGRLLTERVAPDVYGAAGGDAE